MLDPIPFPPKKYPFRIRDKKKEIGTSIMKTKHHVEFLRLNEMYEDDVRIMDCEKILRPELQKKRMSQRNAEKAYKIKIEKKLS